MTFFWPFDGGLNPSIGAEVVCGESKVAVEVQ